MELKMSARELQILRNAESHVPDADGVDIMLTALDEEGLPCFVFNKAPASDGVFLYMVFFKRGIRMCHKLIPIPDGVFEWMGYRPERRRSDMFYRDCSLPDDLVTGLTFA